MSSCIDDEQCGFKACNSANECVWRAPLEGEKPPPGGDYTSQCENSADCEGGSNQGCCDIDGNPVSEDGSSGVDLCFPCPES